MAKRWYQANIVPRRVASAQRSTQRLLAPIGQAFPALFAARADSERWLAGQWTMRWFYSAQVMGPALLAWVAAVTLFIWNVRALEPVWRSMRSGYSAMRWIVGKVVGLPEMVRSWENATDVFHGIRPVLVAAFALMVWPVLRRAGIALADLIALSPADQGQGSVAEAKFSNYASGWPVAALMLCVSECGRALKRWQEGPPTAPPPVISLASVERVVWSAHLARYKDARLRRPQRKLLQDHAAQVVGALRAAEAQQHIDPETALRTLSDLLLTIAERYAEGRLGVLLDEEQINDAAPIVPHAGLRFTAVGLVVVAVVAGAVFAGVPEPAIVALLPLSVLGGAMFLNRGKAPTPSELTHLLIPR
ncbi:hypothetical protein OTB20_17985 [Streptomyces sp. H27-H1]|uniref:hypothetical protein n=1 Tax=Streptomyces sp. H27-H1 TaxID=2996461 RepID=UPI002271F257|nr:hypothetical protein [Streptomyces sp. H27-H1]MCY0928049.1 hypothetical protein [Streptomyces sp. H27-H1]